MINNPIRNASGVRAGGWKVGHRDGKPMEIKTRINILSVLDSKLLARRVQFI